MGFGDRHYNRDEQAGYRPAGGAAGPGAGIGGFIRMHFEGTKVTKVMIIANCAIFVLGMILFEWRGYRGPDNGLNIWGQFNIDQGLRGLQVWRLFTYQFLHANPSHLLFNMLGLFFFGPIVERWLGSRRYLAFYILCGIAGAAAYTATVFAGWLPERNMVGASACILGVLAACAVVAPHMKVLFMMIIPMSMRMMALIYMVFICFNLLTRGDNAGGDAGHLGGAVLGFILISMPWMLNWAQYIPIGPPGGQGSHGGPPKPGYFARMKQKRAKDAARTRREADERDEAEVNRILDKVREVGVHNLTGKEKATLQRATDRQRGQR